MPRPGAVLFGAFERPRGARGWERRFPSLVGSREAMLRTMQDWLISGAFGPTERTVRALKRTSFPLPS
jgi:hypothetical protein